MFGLGSTELLITLAILLLLFGGTRIPQLARALGETFRHMRSGSRDNDKRGDEDD